MEIVSRDGKAWEANKNSIPIKYDPHEVKFSVLNNKMILGLGPVNSVISKGDNDWNTFEMPKYGTGHKAVYGNNEFFVLQDVIPYDIAPNTPAIKTITNITKDGINIDDVELARISQWTGKEFIVGNKATTDFKNWKDIKIPDELSGFRDTIFYKWSDGLYLALVHVNYSNDRERLGEEEALREIGYDRTVYVFDSDFNLIGKHKFDSEIQNIKFTNNMYFVSLRDGRVFRSTDTKGWAESSYTEMLGQPIYNGGDNYIRNDVTDNKISGVSISSDKQNWRNVIVNGEALKHCSLLGDYYMAQGSEKIYFSKDGINWANTAVPFEHGVGGFSTLSTPDYLLVINSRWLFFYTMDAISAALENLDTK